MKPKQIIKGPALDLIFKLIFSNMGASPQIAATINANKFEFTIIFYLKK